LAGRKPSPITASPRVRMLLERNSRSRQVPAWLSKRSSLILKMVDGANNTEAAGELGWQRETAGLWRQRWLEAAPALEQLEREAVLSEGAETTLAAGLAESLKDQPRPGTPATFSPHQIVGIIAVACEDPKLSGYPISHWTPGDLRREIIKRDIVQEISARQVGRFLKRGQPQAPSVALLA
jgi:putative transposase